MIDKAKEKLQKFVTFIKQLDREYFVEKYHLVQRTIGLWPKLRHLKRRDIIHFLKHSRRAMFYGVSGFVIIMLIIPIGTYIYFGRDLRSKDTIMNRKNEGVVLLDRNEKPFFTLFDARTRNPIALKDLPEYTRQAFISVEDRDFYKHPGFSILGIGRAIRQNLLSESFAQGGSTISQQTAKLIWLNNEKTFKRKFKEARLAYRMEKYLSDELIFEIYINLVYFGQDRKSVV